MRKLVLLAALTLVVPAVAYGKWQGDLRICGANGCKTIERHLGHGDWPLLSALSAWPSSEGPAAPAPFYRLTIVPLDANGRPDPAAQSQPIYFVPSARLARNDDGRGGVYWTRLAQLPDRLRNATRALRPFPAPRLTRVVVGNRVARDPQSYVRLYRIPKARAQVRDPAGPRPGEQPTTREVVAYWERVGRLYTPISLASTRESPWTDAKTSLSLWIGRRFDLLMRDGQLVRLPHGLAERIRRGESLR